LANPILLDGAERAHLEAKAVALCGVTLRQYAAIKLMVPDSGTDWLDGMIRKSLRDRLAAKAMQGLLANNNIDAQQISKAAYIVADAMLKEMKA
jgi:hypothetical protein